MMANKVITLLNRPGLPSLLVALVCAHLVADFVLQSDAMVKAKSRWPVLFGHACTHAVMTWILVGWWGFWPLPLAVLIVHAAIDRAKLSLGPRVSAGTGFWVDQCLHLFSLLLFAAAWADQPRPSFWQSIGGEAPVRAMAIASGFIVCVRVSSIAIGHWVEPYLKRISPDGEARVATGNERGLPNGGRTIGQWERALIFLLVFAGIPTGIGFLIAAKSIFRFGELSDRKNRMEAEYITIGTLMSFGAAIAVAYATRMVAGAL
jgi:hypothetical protein